MKKIVFLLTFLFLFSCAGAPKGINPVTDFEVNKYTGTWYEIARLDHRFERNLEKVTATYTLNTDGTLRVDNSGFSTKTNN